MKSSLLAAALAVLLLPLAAFAADDDSLVEVFATGVGTTQDKAHKAADRAAVEQVVGRMVDATTLVENDELVEDRILTYSAALIADSKIVGTPKSADGLITVKVKATVKKTALKEKLVAEKLVSVELDGESLWAQAISAQDNLADAEAMIKDVLAKHIACVVTEEIPGKNGKSTIDYDPKTGETFANVRVHVDMAKYAQFAKEVLDKLGPMAKKKVRVRSKGSYKTDYKYVANGYLDFDVPDLEHGRGDRNFLIVVDNFRSGTATVLWFDENKMQTILECLDTGSLAVEILYFDKTGMEIASGCEPLDNRDQEYKFIPSIFCGGGKGITNGAIVPFFGGSFLTFYSGLRSDNWGDEEYIPSFDRSFRISLGNFTADELKNAGNLKIRVGHMKDGQFVE